MIDVKREDVQKELAGLDAQYSTGIETINNDAKTLRAKLRQRIADRKRKLKRLLDVLDTQEEVTDD